MIDKGKRSKTLSEVKPVKNISKNLQSFLEINLMHMSSRILLDLKEDNSSQRNCQNQLSDPGLSDIEQEC